jgi:CubicO group peptidase (beta-lactamase class C family)
MVFMTDLQQLLGRYVEDGTIPGAVGLIARGDDVAEVAVLGVQAVGGAPMTSDSIFRLASITKPITAAALMMLVDDGRLALDDPVARWLPELAAPVVVRDPAGPADDVLPANRPITVFDLLTNQAGWGFPSRFDYPALQLLFPVQPDGRHPQQFPPVDQWMAALSRVPLLYQPGESWLYDTCSAIQGVLIARVTGVSLPEALSSRVFEPLGMVDTGFVVPASSRPRFTSYYRAGLELVDGPDGEWSTMPAFPLGSGGLAGTAFDWLSFARMLLSGSLLSRDAVRLMTTDHTTPAQREIGALFLEGDGWGFGGSVSPATGRYGWVGGTGTSAHIYPSSGGVAILLAQVGVDSPEPAQWLRDFWRYSDLALA